MNKVLILFAHPKFEASRTNRALVNRIKEKEGVTLHDLYEEYPDFNIDVSFEKDLLKSHDILIWHHPLYWFSCPPLMKHWIDLVLEFDWAYGPGGDALKCKTCLNVITSEGTRAVYCAEGTNNYSVNEFLRPFEQTARLCGMQYLPPFAVMGTHKLSNDDLEGYANQYMNLIHLLQQDKLGAVGVRRSFLNDMAKLKNIKAL